MKILTFVGLLMSLSPVAALALPPIQTSMSMCNVGLNVSKADANSFARGAVSTWDEYSNTWGQPRMQVVKAGFDSFNFFTNSANTLGTKISQLSLGFGSEVYSTFSTYDFCFRGPAKNYYDDVPARQLLTHVTLDSQLMIVPYNPVTGLSVESDRTYLNNAKPTVRTTIACDRQGEGRYKYARNGMSPDSGSLGSIDSDIDFRELDRHRQGNSDFFNTARSEQITYNSSFLLNAFEITTNTANVPRFCILRVEIVENSTMEHTNSSLISNFQFSNVIEQTDLVP